MCEHMAQDTILQVLGILIWKWILQKQVLDYNSTWTRSVLQKSCLNVLSLYWALDFSAELERMPDCTGDWLDKIQKPDFLLLCQDDETGHSLSSSGLHVHMHAVHTLIWQACKWMYKVEIDHLTCLVGNLMMKSVCQGSCAKNKANWRDKSCQGACNREQCLKWEGSEWAQEKVLMLPKTFEEKLH